ncbi:chymotrypsin-like elastase family member 2A [Convolutriloba macropyga]|uniref:chymotrypsin-like elastase family member 2A n=1 Tax=Convolutriloba macropyga TaxID=536237 RepID=UPI003F521F82
MRRHRGVNHQICGGTIIHEDWILTAAHCVSRIDSYKLLIETGDFTNKSAAKTRVYIEEMIWPHQKRNSLLHYFKCDIALLKVRDFKFPQDSILQLCRQSREKCRILGSCGMGQTNGSNSKSLPRTLKELKMSLHS